MSTNIEFQRGAFRAGRDRYGHPIFIAVAETGSNNVLEAYSDRISRDWDIVGFGSMTDLITGPIMTIASLTEGGMHRYQNGDTKPENYIANWRETLTNGVMDFEKFLYQFPDARAVVRFGENEVEDLESRTRLGWDVELYELLSESDEWEREVEDYFGKTVCFSKPLQVVEDVEELLELPSKKYSPSQERKSIHI